MTEQSTDERSVGIVRAQTIRLELPEEGFRLAKGGVLPEVTVAYETYGELSPRRDNAVYICHALTGDAHVAGYHTPNDAKPGWWDEMVGPGKGIDTDFYHVVCANILGGCQGSTGPGSANPSTGKPYGSSFPEITARDIVDVQRLLLLQLGVTQLAAVVGGSFGGMQVLEWSIRHPDKVARCVCIASGASLSAQALAFDVVSRDAIESDPNWANGDYYDKEKKPEWGLAHARKIGHITYLSSEMMQEKFGREKTPTAGRDGEQNRFQVESYLDYQGQRLVERFDANSYLRITQAMDSFDLVEEFGSLEKAFANVRAKFLVIALSSDWLFPPEQSHELATSLLRAGKQVSCCTLKAPHGHDSFLVDIEYLSETVRAFLPWVSPHRKGQAPLEPKSCAETMEHRLIRERIEPNARALDLGCGNGSLLSLLAADNGVSGLGLDIDLDNVIDVINKGHDIFQGDLDKGLAIVADKAYDYAILSGALQVVGNPRLVLREMVRVATEGIVTFPNFGNWFNRLMLGVKGRMPRSPALPFEWYETPNIHLATLKDFVALCRQEQIEILEIVCIPSCALDKLLVSLKLCNLGAERILIRITKSRDAAPQAPLCHAG